MPYIILPSLAAGQVLTASYLNQLNDNLRVVGKHNHSGSAGEGASSLNVSSSAASPYLNRYEIVPYIAPSQTNFSTSTQASTILFGMHRQSTTSCPASIMFPVGLFAGVYQLEIMHEMNTDLGIASILVGQTGATACVWGELDQYASAAACNQKTSFTGSIPTSASHVITIRTWGDKNVSSAGSIIRFQAMKIRKTGGY